MFIVTNDKLVKRNRLIAQVTMIGGLVVLIGGMVVSFQMPEQISLSFGALLVGFILSQVGIYFSNRWGRRPRPDELLNQALKGLDQKYRLYHYETPAAHLLVGPAGIWALFLYHQRGTITFEKGRWRQKGGGLMMNYLKIFAQEGIGRPDLEIQSEISGLKRHLEKYLAAEQIPEIQAAMVFTNDRVELKIDEEANPPAITVTLGKLKELLRKQAKNKPVSMTTIDAIQAILPAEA